MTVKMCRMTIQHVHIRSHATTFWLKGVPGVHVPWFRGIYEWGAGCCLHVLTGHSFQHPFVSAAPPNSKKAKCSEGNCVLGFFLVVY